MRSAGNLIFFDPEKNVHLLMSMTKERLKVPESGKTYFPISLSEPELQKLKNSLKMSITPRY